jgi:diguanylate cyclase (GGDEF)-like protein
MDRQAKAGERSRRGWPRLSVRARLVALALFIIAPLVFERVHGLEAARTDRLERAHAEVIDLARRGTESQRDVIYSVRTLLQVLARVYARTPLDAANCNRYLGDMAGNIAWLRALSVAAPNGQIKCSTDPQAAGLNVADRSYFQSTLGARDFALSDYLINRTHQLPSVVATYPAVGDDGVANAVVLAVINLQWIGELVDSAAQRSGASVLLLDGTGTLLAASTKEQALVGRKFPDSELVQEMLRSDQGSTTTAGLDGLRRIFAYVRVPWTDARLAVGLDESTVQAGIDRELSIAYLQLAAFTLFVLLVAWFGGEQLIVRPIRSLARTAARFGRGDLHVRATQESWLPEFAPLAAALDDMAHKLTMREEELHFANQHLEELASLDGLTGLANRRGFDHRLEAEWDNALQCGGPVALMMIDIDYFKRFNDRYGHVAGDTCLRSVGETLSVVTLEDAVLVARYGGEEFALLLPGLDLARATALAEEARRAIEEMSIAHAEAPYGYVTISIGVESMVPQRDQIAASLVERADTALYEAKRNGRNRVIARGIAVEVADTRAPIESPPLVA